MVWKVVGYYPKLEQAAQRLLDKYPVSASEANTLRELIEAIREAREAISRAVQEVA